MAEVQLGRGRERAGLVERSMGKMRVCWGGVMGRYKGSLVVCESDGQGQGTVGGAWERGRVSYMGVG